MFRAMNYQCAFLAVLSLFDLSSVVVHRDGDSLSETYGEKISEIALVISWGEERCTRLVENATDSLWQAYVVSRLERERDEALLNKVACGSARYLPYQFVWY